MIMIIMTTILFSMLLITIMFDNISWDHNFLIDNLYDNISFTWITNGYGRPKFFSYSHHKPNDIMFFLPRSGPGGRTREQLIDMGLIGVYLRTSIYNKIHCT